MTEIGPFYVPHNLKLLVLHRPLIDYCMYHKTWNQPEQVLGVAQRPGPILQGTAKC
jgi:hypothetical protein